MWKRFLVIIIALVGTFSVVYAYQHELFADSSSVTYVSGGSLTGRINQAPSGITGSNIGLQKGDKVLMGTTTLENEELGWQLINYVSDPSYSYLNPLDTTKTISNGVRGWLTLSTTPIKKGVKVFDNTRDSRLFQDTNLKPILDKMNEKISSNYMDYSLLTSRYMKYAITSYNNILSVSSNPSIASCSKNDIGFYICYGFSSAIEQLGKLVYVPNKGSDFGVLYLNDKNVVSFKSEDYLNDFLTDYTYWESAHYSSSVGAQDWLIVNDIKSYETSGDVSSYSDVNVSRNIRGAAYLNLQDVVFAVSNGTTNGLGVVSELKLPADYKYLKTASDPYKNMKLRIKDTSMNVSVDPNIYATNENVIQEIGTMANFKVTASANSVKPNSVISVIVLNEQNEFVYYQPLSQTVAGENLYAFDTTDMASGTYKFIIVNEIYDSTSNTPVYSSELSAPITATVTDTLPLSALSVSNIKEYSYGEIMGTDIIGTINTANGYKSPVYKIVEDIAYPDEYSNFELGTFIDHKANIMVKGSATKMLDVGTYHFKIQAQDTNGDPSTPLTQDVTVTVAKATPTISLGATSKEYIELQGGAVSKTDYTYSTTNTDSTWKPSFTLSGGVAGKLSVSLDKDKNNAYVITPDSTYSGTALPATYTLQYTSPETKNYNAVTTPITREFVLYKKLSDLTWTQTPASIKVDDVTKANVTIGNLLAKDGIGDFTYEIIQPGDVSYIEDTGKDHASFQLEKTTGAKDEKINLKTTGALIARTYQLQLRVTDQRKDTKEIAISITVKPSAQEDLYFVNAKDEDITATGLSFSFTDTGVKLLAKGGSGTGAITYALADNQPSGITASEYLKVDAGGALTPLKVGTVNVTAEKAKDDTHASISVTMPVTITEGDQELSFNKDMMTQLFVKNGTFDGSATLTENKVTSTRTITYDSTTKDICTIDTEGAVTMVKTGTCTITASNTDDNYKEVSISKNIELYHALDGSFTQKNTPQAEDGSGSAGKYIGDVSAKDGYGKKTYAIANADSLFHVDSTTGEVTMRTDLHVVDLKDAWDTDKKAYILKETVTISDEVNNVKDIEISVTCTGAKLTLSFQDAMNDTITKEYGSNTYYTFVIKNNTGDGKVTYSIESNPSSELSDLNTSTGRVKLSHVSDKNNPAKVKAEVSAAKGYDSASISINVVISAGTQTIAFDKDTKDKQEYKQDGTFTVNAALTRSDTTSGTITYEASPSSICTITSNKVSMLDTGTCTITISNKDENYEEVEDTKDILIYKSAIGTFTQTTIPQAEENAKSDTILGTFSGEGGQGTLSYALSDGTGKENEAAGLLAIDETDGAITLSKDITASDIKDFAYQDGYYKLNFQVVIKDDGKMVDTFNCTANIKGAPLKNVKFKDETGGVITKTFGDTFKLSLLDNTGGDPTYSIKEDASLPTDVITAITGSVVTITHANDPDNPNLPIIIASIPAKNGYDAKEISAKVSVSKAKQDDFQFHDENLNMKTEALITPVFDNVKTTEGVALESSDETILAVVKNDLKSNTKTGTVTITATANSDRDYEEKVITKDITVYDELGGSLKQSTPYAQANTDTATEGTAIGKILVDGGQGTVKREIIVGNEYFVLSSDTANVVKLNKDITATDLIGKWDVKKKAYVLKIKIKLTDEADTEFIMESDIYIQGAPLADASFVDEENAPTKHIQKTYKQNGEFNLSITGNTGSGAVTYRLKDDATMPDDVLLDVESDGTAYIENANDPSVNANDVIVEAVISAANGYEEKTIKCIVEITQAEQDFEFDPKDDDIEIKVSDTYTPTFTATPKDGNVKLELKNPVSDSEKVIITDTAITAKKAGELILQATAPGGRNYKDAVREKKVIVYEDMSAVFTQTVIPQAETDSAGITTPVGTFTLSGGIKEVSASIDPAILDGAYFDITNKTTITIKQDIDVEAIKDKWNETEKAYVMKVSLHLTDSDKNETDIPISIKIQGAPLEDVAFKGEGGKGTFTITKTYSKTPFSIEVVENSGDGDVSYQLKQNVIDADGSKVISEVSSNGIVTIENANEKTNPDKVIVEAIITPKNGYDGKTIEGEIYIEQAPQPNLRFKEKEVSLYYNGSADTILQNKLSSGEVTYSSNDTSIVTVDDVGTLKAGTTTGDATITASVAEDRNYQKASTKMIVHVTQNEEYPLTIQVPTPTYGDSPIHAEIKDQGASGANLTQTWTSSKEEIATIDADGNITIHHAGKTTITLSQTSDGEPDVSASVTLTVKPKPIELTVADKEMATGADVPEFTLEEIQGLVEGDEDSFVLPAFSCADKNDEEVTSLTPAGEYPIKAVMPQGSNPDYKITAIHEGTLTITQDTSTNAWYRLESEAERTASGWYNKPVHVYLETAAGNYDEISNSSKGPWADHFEVSTEGIHQTEIYFRNSTSNAISTKQEREIKIDYHKPEITSIAGIQTNTSAYAELIHTLTLGNFYKKGVEIKILASDPIPDKDIKVSGVDTITYKVYEVIEGKREQDPIKQGESSKNPASVTMDEAGIYEVCATATDHAGNTGNEICQEAEIKKLDVDVDGDNKPDFNDPDGNGCADFNIVYKDEEGNWITLNEDKDRDGIPERNIDSDGDGEPDINVDTDNDGLPDRNLVIMTKELWKPTMCVSQHGEQYASGIDITPQINVDTDHNGIPDINIDTSGDMKADINVSKDGIHPYLNIAIIHTPWLPETNYTYQKFDYDTQIDFKRYLNIDTNNDGLPDVNIDLDGDGIADLNIDTTGNEIPNVDIDGDGDGKSDVNLDTNGDGIPDKDVMEITEWNPTHTVEGEIVYGTSFIDRLDYLEHHGIQVAKQKDRFLPNYAIRVSDVTNEKQEEITGIIQKEGRKIAAIYEVDLLQDGIKVQPDGKLIIRIPVLEGLVNPSLLIQTADGNYQAVNAEIKEGYYVIESDYLGIISILNEEIPSTVDQPAIIEDKNTGGAVQQNVKTSVAGSFTGDETTYGSYILGSGVSFLCLLFLYKRKKA